MSVSEAQLTANLANALLSTGPRSGEGKQRSSQNAVRHALFSKTIPEPDQEAYRRSLVQYQQELQPKGIVEHQFVETIAGTEWRLARCRELQHSLLFAETETPDQQLDALGKYSLYEQRLTRIVQSNLKQLREIQTGRHLREEQEFRDAAQLSKSFAAKGVPYDPAEDGFVFSLADLALWIYRADRLQLAKIENAASQVFGKRPQIPAFS